MSLQQLEPTRFCAYKFKPVIAVLQVQNYLLCCTFGVVSCDVHFVYYKQILCVCLAQMHFSKRSLKFSHCVYASFCLKMLFFLNNLTKKKWDCKKSTSFIFVTLKSHSFLKKSHSFSGNLTLKNTVISPEKHTLTSLGRMNRQKSIHI